MRASLCIWVVVALGSVPGEGWAWPATWVGFRGGRGEGWDSTLEKCPTSSGFRGLRFLQGARARPSSRVPGRPRWDTIGIVSREGAVVCKGNYIE